MSEVDEVLTDITYAIGHVLVKHMGALLGMFVFGPIQTRINKIVKANGWKGPARLASARATAIMAEDGAFLEGPVPIGYAKFAIRKGMPEPGQKVMAVENEPHIVNDFDGVIEEGYGKGIKKLVWSGTAVVKIAGKTFLSKVNIHEHQADKAGLHYDFVAEGVASGTEQFEVSIPNGDFKGRYAFIRPEGFDKGQLLITRMKERAVVLPKPRFALKQREYLEELEKDPNKYVVEWKPDGSLANVIIHDNRAIFTSHREQASAYYDKLPALEWLSNRSRLLSSRLLFSGPNQEGTLLKGELFHPDGAARVGGMLNSLPEKSIAIQSQKGPIVFHAWDLVKLRGKDVSHLSYGERREILTGVISDIRRFNGNWRIVPAADSNFIAFYDKIVGDPRGLPFAEGVVIKSRSSPSGETWGKVKFRDSVDVRVLKLLEGVGKRAGKVGRMLVETTGGGTGEVGSFKATDAELEWMWNNRDLLEGQVAEIYAQEITTAGAPRAGVFWRWHPTKSDYGLLMYSLDDRNTMYAIKSAAGWRK